MSQGHLCQGDFQAPEIGLLFETVSPGSPYEKSMKMGDLSVLADIVITRLCGPFRSHGLPQSVVRYLYLKRILIQS